MDKVKNFYAYFYITLIVVFSSFEYFFRIGLYLQSVYLLGIFHLLIKREKLHFYNIAYSLAVLAPFVFLLQAAFGKDANFNAAIGQILIILGLMSICTITGIKTAKPFVKIIVFIATYSLIIYLICLNPSIKSYLYNNIATNNSLGVEKALFDGGGRNFIIYNFQTDFVFEMIGFSRNCGPFWEPGMFAVFLNLALFVNLFINHSRLLRFDNLILSGALISTFSTGGYISALVLFLFYIINKGLSFKNLAIYIPIAAVLVVTVINLEYVGEKTQHQLEHAEIGNDHSRYGALLTQLVMIDNSPIIGGEKIKDYASTKALASGTLWPLVVYGIPVGLIFYLCFCKGLIRFSILNNSSKRIGYELIIFILILSFSQTILQNALIMYLMFCGLIKRPNHV